MEMKAMDPLGSVKLTLLVAILSCPSGLSIRAGTSSRKSVLRLKVLCLTGKRRGWHFFAD